MAAPPIRHPLSTPPTDSQPAPAVDLRAQGFINPGAVYARLSSAGLAELAVLRGEGLLTERGALVAYTGERTGRSPQDRYVLADAADKSAIWWGPVNRPIEPPAFDRLFDKVQAYLQGRDWFITDCWACADPRYRLSVRIVCEKAWQALFARCLLLRPTPEQLEAASGFQPQLTIASVPGLRADPAVDGTRSSAFVVLNLPRRLVLIGGTHYAGEIKKSVFSVLNYLLPQRGVFPMHCSANIGAAGDTALFFGLSGTGKTTLSADPERRLIGDDEHAWSETGVFNIEGGCYAKTIRLSPEGEPQIWNALQFGCLLENVVVDPETRRPDFDDDRFTENTRAAYPVDFIPNHEASGRGGHPANVVFLTCDAFGVLPPVSRLTPEQALFHFLSGYTAKVAGTETGVTEPEVAFSTCFAAPFLPLHPTRYAELLHQKLQAHRSQVWLVNTGWTGGSYGRGSRIKLGLTRAMVRAVLGGDLARVPFMPDPIFGVFVPESCPGVPSEVLRPRNTWPNLADYDAQARKLAALFQDNFTAYAAQTSEAVRQAGPKV
jgi:phosphoenolpyruvate carboxykinase (ATP)